MRKARMEIWLLLSVWAMNRALTLADKMDDMKTVLRIAATMRVWLEEDDGTQDRS